MTIDPSPKASAISVVAVVLGAGRSSRMGASGPHKLLVEFEGVPLIRRSTLIALGSECRSVVVVSGHQTLEIQAAIKDLDVQAVYNEHYSSGIGSSLALGVRVAQTSQPDGIMIVLADMPVLTSANLNALIAAFRDANGASVVRATAQGTSGNPVIFPRPLYHRLQDLSSDIGARRVIEKGGLPVVNVEIGEAALVDVDTQDQVAAAGGVLPAQIAPSVKR
ncbi:nucleotidyltransferase family protein [Rhizobium sp. CF142]|uniref:nucleotidyltransferase family protein n=1 Tax=Rhizobium sp. CF142 TaxID=1144314 RepID=UPI00026EF457|nr:nucleotidyltransferase family protein [Rhizobium sp. CF142]EJJ29509.1 putative MobA-like protein [Rhizobium sp. CF142]